MKIPHYEIVNNHAGSGEWLTLLHGYSQHGGLFSAQIEYFRAHYRLLLIDLPGHGKSLSMAGPYGQAEYTQAVVAALDAAGVQRTHLWGTHTGSAISLLIARCQPDRVMSLVLEGAVLPGMTMSYVAQAVARAKSSAQEHGVEAARAEWFNECQWFDVIRNKPLACRAEAHWQLLQDFAGKPWLDTLIPATVSGLVEQLLQIQQPVLLMNGELDLPEFLEHASILESQLPHVQRVMIAGAGGFPLWEFPGLVNPLVRQFLVGQQ